MFWDVRLEKLLKKGTKKVDETDVVWKPMHVVHLLSVAGGLQVVLRQCHCHYWRQSLPWHGSSAKTLHKCGTTPPQDWITAICP